MISHQTVCVMSTLKRIFKRGNDTNANSSSRRQLIATLDFGKQHSGYALHFRDDPAEMQRSQGHNAGNEEFIHVKIPTSMLLKPNQKLFSIGYAAEKKYDELTRKDKHRGWMMFREFNMMLHNKELLKDLTIGSTVKDTNGIPILAMEIFSMSIGFLKDHLLKALSDKNVGVKKNDIQYEITVPSSWNDTAKDFIMEAAVQAGLDLQRGKISLVPEEASIRCKSVNSDSKSSLHVSDIDCQSIRQDLAEDATKGPKSSSSHLIVAAFDFGTTYSGYAFSFRDDPTRIQTNKGWNAGSESLISLKTPTCVLLTPNKQFNSFGFEAENKYANLVEEDEHHGWMLFQRFKMLLHHNKGLTRESTVEDINGKSMRAMEIFSMSIGFLRDHLLQTLNTQIVGIKETDIQYVITVPALWNDNAKQFMREAAVEAGLDSQRVKLSLEPEAASVWCQTVNTDVTSSLSDSGCQYMVVDLGGGTADISVHEKKVDGTLKEINKASGGPWGGTVVDKNYFDWLIKVFGQTTMNRFKNEHIADFFDAQRQFETKKRSFHHDTQEKVTIRVPTSLMKIYNEIEDKNDLNRKVADMGLSDMVKVTVDKLRLDASIVRSWFEEPIQQTITHVKHLLGKEKTQKVNKILLVGGFGECKIVQEMLRNQLQNKTLIVPDEAGLVVLKGAVRFGQMPEIISSRIMKYTYGVEIMGKYDEECHSESDILFNDEGDPLIGHVFRKFVTIGEEISLHHEVTKCFKPTKFYAVSIPVYCTTDPNPKFTTDHGCNVLGDLECHFQDGLTLKDNITDVTLSFGDTELIVRAKIIRSGREFYTSINCLK